MDTMEPQAPLSFRSAGLMALKDNWGLFLALGIGLILLGVAAIACPVVTGVAVIIVIGAMLLVGGVLQFIAAFFTRAWGAFFLNLLVGILYVIVGLWMLKWPLQSLAALTILIAAALLVGGAFRIVNALVARYEGWGLVLLGGIIDVLLGLFIWVLGPYEDLWVIGTFLGINLIFSGVTWAALALSIRQVPQRPAEAPPQAAPPQGA
jgi:uncharacterized membrane protein HdeD (DUF308 family)